MQTTDRTALLERIARRAGTANRTPANARILHVTHVGLTVIVATEQPGQDMPYCVDSYRLLTAPERDPEEWWPYQPAVWTLTGEWGGAGRDEIPGMLARAAALARTAA